MSSKHNQTEVHPWYQNSLFGSEVQSPQIVVIQGLPGAGKSTLAEALAHRIQAGHINADVVRRSVNRDLGFSDQARFENAHRLGAMAAITTGFSPLSTVIVDFVNPTRMTRSMFVDGILSVHPKFQEPNFVKIAFVFLDTIQRDACRFSDTAAMFEPPSEGDPLVIRVCDYANESSVEDRVNYVRRELLSRGFVNV